jgi:catechol-2,3-dioxygenase
MLMKVQTSHGNTLSVLSQRQRLICNLTDVLHYLSDKHDQVHFDGLADHLVSEAIYIRDPDFNGVEIIVSNNKPSIVHNRHIS